MTDLPKRPSNSELKSICDRYKLKITCLEDDGFVVEKIIDDFCIKLVFETQNSYINYCIPLLIFNDYEELELDRLHENQLVDYEEIENLISDLIEEIEKQIQEYKKLVDMLQKIENHINFKGLDYGIAKSLLNEEIENW